MVHCRSIHRFVFLFQFVKWSEKSHTPCTRSTHAHIHFVSSTFATPAISQPINHTTMIPKIESSRQIGQKEGRRIGSGELEPDLRRQQQSHATWPACNGCGAQQTGSHPWSPEKNAEDVELWFCNWCNWKRTGWWHYDDQTKRRNGTQYGKCIKARKGVAKQLEEEGRAMLDAAEMNFNWTEQQEQRKLGHAKLAASKCAAAELAASLETWDENGRLKEGAMGRCGGSSSSGMEVDNWM